MKNFKAILFYSLVAILECSFLQANTEVSDNCIAMEMPDIQFGDFGAPERLAKRREELEKRNKKLLEKKNEDCRVKNEIEVTNKLKKAFGMNYDENRVEQVGDISLKELSSIANKPAGEYPIIELEQVDKNDDSDSLEMDDMQIGDFGPTPFEKHTGKRFLKRESNGRNKKLLDKKIEEIRHRDGAALTKKLKAAFDKAPTKKDKENSKNKYVPIPETVKEMPSEDLLKNIQKELVVESNKNERVDSTQLKDRRLMYTITLLKIPNNEQLLPTTVIESSNTFMRDKYCGQSVVGKLRGMDIPIINSYKATNGDLLYEVSVNPSSCEKSP